MFLSQDGADITFAVNELCQRMSVGTRRQRDKWIQVFELRDVSSEVTVFFDLDWAGDKETRKSSSAGVALFGRHLLKACTRKQKIIARRRSSIGTVRSEGGPEHVA